MRDHWLITLNVVVPQEAVSCNACGHQLCHSSYIPLNQVKAKTSCSNLIVVVWNLVSMDAKVDEDFRSIELGFSVVCRIQIRTRSGTRRLLTWRDDVSMVEICGKKLIRGGIHWMARWESTGSEVGQQAKRPRLTSFVLFLAFLLSLMVIVVEA